MEVVFENKINLLKAFAIMLVVSGHLGISLIPFFPTYSFHMSLFFFISGYLFKEKHINDIWLYTKNKAKRLLIPCIWYNVAYLIITLIVAKLTGIYFGSPINIKNFAISPFIDGSQLLFLRTLWFVTQLFISLTVFIITFKYLRKLWDNKYFHLICFFILAIISIQISIFKDNPMRLIILRTMFSMFFLYLGYFYKNFIEGKRDILNAKYFITIIIIQAILWLYNTSDAPRAGLAVGLDYVLATGEFCNRIVPILTSITGIWASLFIVNAFFPYLKNNKFVNQIGENTYHIMANHLFIIYLITNFFIWLNGLPASSITDNGMFWVYNSYKTSYLYFITALIISTWIGIGITSINSYKSSIIEARIKNPNLENQNVGLVD